MDIKKKAMLDALVEAKGVIQKACNANNNLARSTYYKWYNDDEEFKKAADEIQEIALDFVEGKLYDLIDKNDTTATIFYLKTKGKRRGYVERSDNDLPPVIITTSVSKEEAIDIYKTLNELC